VLSQPFVYNIVSTIHKKYSYILHVMFA